MRRILVPLDGSDFGGAVLDDAMRLAGDDGTLILMKAINRPFGKGAVYYNFPPEIEAARDYLSSIAEGLRTRGVRVDIVTKSTIQPAAAITEVARSNQVDMIACATHSRGAIGRLLWGSVAWQVLAHSSIPILLRHPTAGPGNASTHGEERRILVPLDGSRLAEYALPLAQELAREWQAPIDLVTVATDAPRERSAEEAETYLNRVKASLTGQVQSHVLIGHPEGELAAFVWGAGVTDVVMASHGRTGLARMVLGSVASDIIHRLPLPVIVVPALAAAAGMPADAGVPAQAGIRS